MNPLLRTLLVALLLASPVGLAAGTPSAMKTVIGLYRDYAWEAAFDFTDARAIPFQLQSRAVLSRYLAPRLVTQILRDRAAAAKTRTTGALDFSPLWDAQDPVGSSVQIRQEAPTTVVVLLNDCQGKAPRELTYHLVRTPQGWRIADIGYGPGRPSLALLLGTDQ